MGPPAYKTPDHPELSFAKYPSNSSYEKGRKNQKISCFKAILFITTLSPPIKANNTSEGPFFPAPLFLWLVSSKQSWKQGYLFRNLTSS